MKKFILLTIPLLIVTTCLTGCLRNDRMENIKIATTIYPIEYVTNRLYGGNATIESIYPRNSVIETYNITNKQLKDYSEYDLFIYNGKSKEREYATKMLNNNKRLKIIDAAYGLDTTYKQTDIWLNPSNILMLGQNIKDELTEYINNKTLLNDINDKYTTLKVDMTELETEFKKTADNSISPKIVVADESLNFLKKYGFQVINLTDDGQIKEKNVDKARELFAGNKLNYIFVMENSDTNENAIIEALLNSYKIETLKFTNLNTLSEKQENENEDYLSIMHNNIDLLKKETYK